MALTARLDSEVPRGLSGALMLLLEELALGMVQLDDEGAIVHLNETAQQILDGASGLPLRKALREVCSGTGPLPKPAEFIVAAGGAGELRLILTRATHRPGFVAVIQHNLESRLRAEVAALRAMLAAAADAVPPQEAAMRVLATIAQSLRDCGLHFHQVDADAKVLRPIACAGAGASGSALDREQPLDPKASTLGRVATFGQPVHLADLARSPFGAERELALPGARRALLAVPVRVGGEVTGVLSVSHPAGVLGEGELRMVQGLADAVGMLLHRARADAAVAAEAAARRSLMENLPEAIVEQGAQGTISLAAGRVQPILGRLAAEAVGIPVEELLVDEDRERFGALVASAREGGPLAQEVTVLTPSGKRVPCEVSVSTTGGVLRAVFRDISIRRALEADVLRAREIATRREKLAAIGQLAAGVAHEINNPLSFVKSNLSTMGAHLNDLGARVERVSTLLEPEREGDLSAEELVSDMKDMAAESHSGIERIASIVQALKGMARGRSDERSAFNPAKAIHDAALIFRGAKRGCEVEVELEDLPPIKGSPGALGQVILNLLDNALDAMGGAGTIRVKGLDCGDRLRLTVGDNGSGIPDEIRDRVFEPFFTTKESGKGTGLGLYICFEIVKQMLGEISFESGPEGTVFTIEIPAAD